MTDVFVSYAHVDDADVRRIVQALEQLGLQVWWDISLRSGDRYGNVIENQLTEAKCVLAVWSRNSRNSDWVRAEASIGNDANKLVQVILQRDVRPPLPFNIIHYEPVIGGPRDSDENWGQLVDAIRQRVGGVGAERAPARAPSPITPTTVCSVLAALGLAAYVAALNVPAFAQALRAIPQAFGSPANLLLYAATAFGAGSALLTMQAIAASARAGR